MFHNILSIPNTLLIRCLENLDLYKILSLVLLTFFIFPSFAENKLNSNIDTPWTKVSSFDSHGIYDIYDIIDKMPLKDKVGQLFAFGYLGQDISGNPTKVINNFGPGSIITFKRNIYSPNQMARLNYQLAKLTIKKTKIAPFIMIDQEGGLVTRIRTNPLPPSALSIGMTQNSSYSERLGEATGRLLKGLGFHINLAPVLDSSDPYKKSFIGNRSYGKNIEMIQTMAQSFIAGLSRKNILPTFKHFPGHGGLTQDSHFKLPTKLSTLKELEINEVKPFRKLMSTKSPFALMVAHIAFPNIDESGRPATFSKVLIDDLIRKKYRFNGLVITDDLEMAGADFIPDIGERAIAAIKAGCDILILTGRHTTKLKAYKAVYKAVKNGRIPLNRIHKSLYRILNEKNRLGLIDTKPRRSSLRSIAKLMKKYRRDINNLTSAIAIENLENSFKKYPELKGSVDLSNQLRVFTASSSIYYNIKKKVKIKPVLHRLRRDKSLSINDIMKKKPNDIGLFYVSGTGTARMLNRLTNFTKSRLIVINTTYPGLINHPKRFKAVFNLNTKHPRAGEWVAQYLINGRPQIRQPAATQARYFEY